MTVGQDGRPLLAQAAALIAMIAALAIRREDLAGPAVSLGLARVLLAGSLVGIVALLAPRLLPRRT